VAIPWYFPVRSDSDAAIWSAAGLGGLLRSAGCKIGSVVPMVSFAAFTTDPAFEYTATTSGANILFITK
jgi:hypothetical protein